MSTFVTATPIGSNAIMKLVCRNTPSSTCLIPLILLLALVLPSCKSFEAYYNRDSNIHQRINSLELGMTKQNVLNFIQYQPDFINREAYSDGLREIFVYRGSYSRHGWMEEATPMVYRLVFENNTLVVIDSDKDFEQIRINDRRRFEQERKEAEEKRTAALIEAQKKSKEKEK